MSLFQSQDIEISCKMCFLASVHIQNNNQRALPDISRTPSDHFVCVYIEKDHSMLQGSELHTYSSYSQDFIRIHNSTPANHQESIDSNHNHPDIHWNSFH